MTTNKPLFLVFITAFLLSSCGNLPSIKISIEDKNTEETAEVTKENEEETLETKAESKSEPDVASSTEPEPIEEVPQSSTNENDPKAISQSAPSITPQQLNRRVKQFTVRIDGASNGSGVIVDESEDTYTVLTNWHVVQEPGDYTVQTSDGREHQVDYQQVEQMPEVDLALVKFSSEENYQKAKVGDSDYLSEGQGVHLAGYPGVKTNNDRLYRFYNLNVVGLLNKPIDQGYAVLYEGETISGMSGSPLLDNEGTLVGIHGMYRVEDPTIRKGSSYAIPINTYKELASTKEPVASNIPQDGENQQPDTPETENLDKKGENPGTNQTPVATKQQQEVENTPNLSNDTNSEKINLLDSKNGGKIVVASDKRWEKTIDGSEGSFYSGRENEEVVFGFNDGSIAVFDTFRILIPDTDITNVKEIELFVGNDSPTGNFESIGKFQTENLRYFDNPYQALNFEPIEAKYLKVKIISGYDQSRNYAHIYEFQLLGNLKEN